MVTLVPSNGGERVYVGGLGPAPSNVMVPDWRISGCQGAAIVRLRVARSAAAAVVMKSFIVGRTFDNC